MSSVAPSWDELKSKFAFDDLGLMSPDWYSSPPNPITDCKAVVHALLGNDIRPLYALHARYMGGNREQVAYITSALITAVLRAHHLKCPTKTQEELADAFVVGLGSTTEVLHILAANAGLQGLEVMMEHILLRVQEEAYVGWSMPERIHETPYSRPLWMFGVRAVYMMTKEAIMRLKEMVGPAGYPLVRFLFTEGRMNCGVHMALALVAHMAPVHFDEVVGMKPEKMPLDVVLGHAGHTNMWAITKVVGLPVGFDVDFEMPLNKSMRYAMCHPDVTHTTLVFGIHRDPKSGAIKRASVVHRGGKFCDACLHRFALFLPNMPNPPRAYAMLVRKGLADGHFRPVDLKRMETLLRMAGHGKFPDTHEATWGVALKDAGATKDMPDERIKELLVKKQEEEVRAHHYRPDEELVWAPSVRVLKWREDLREAFFSRVLHSHLTHAKVEALKEMLGCE